MSKIILYFSVGSFFLSLLVGIAIAETPPTTSKEADAEQIAAEVEKVQKTLESTQTSLKKAKDQFDEIAKTIDDLKGDIVRLKSGSTILTNGKKGSDLVTLELAELDEMLKKIDNDRKEIIGQTKLIFETVTSLRFMQVGERRPNEPHKFLKLLIEKTGTELSKPYIAALEKAAGSEDQISDTVNDLDDAIADFRRNLSGAAPVGVIEKIADLTKSLKELKPEPFKALSGAEEATRKLAGEIYRLSPVEEIDGSKNSVMQISTNAATLNGQIPLPTGPNANEPLHKVLIENAVAIKNLTALQTKLGSAINGQTGLVAKILEAKLGDTPYPSNVIEDRWCDATNRMAKECDRKATCNVPDNHQFELCGTNPAPGARPERRGIYVRYRCVQNIEKNFATTYPANSRVAKTRRTLRRHPSHYLILRHGGAFQCSAE